MIDHSQPPFQCLLIVQSACHHLSRYARYRHSAQATAFIRGVRAGGNDFTPSSDRLSAITSYGLGRNAWVALSLDAIKTGVTSCAILVARGDAPGLVGQPAGGTGRTLGHIVGRRGTVTVMTMIGYVDENTRAVGARIREIRTWRRKSLTVVAELAGVTKGYLSRIERGERPIHQRSLVEAIANALQVAPSELLAEPFPAIDPVSREAHASIDEIGIVLAHNRLGQPFREQAQPWPQIEAKLRQFLGELVPACDYVAQAKLLPGLLEELYASHATDSAHRREALIGLMYTLQHAAALLKNLGAHGLPHLAATHMRYAADKLEEPAWAGAAEWRVGQSSGGDRARMIAVSLRAAEQLQTETGHRAQQTYAMLHLNAALASAAMNRPEDARAHLAEAHEMVRPTDGAPDFMDMHFNATNWAVWRVAIGVELGEGPGVAEFARAIDVSTLPAAERRGMFYGDLARGLAQDKSRRDEAVRLLRIAEEIAPQRIRTNPYVRETVVSLVRQAKRDALGTELKGLAYRMGIAG